MEYIYAAMVLHEADREISESNLTAMLDVVGIEVNESRVQALVAALEDVDIEAALSSTVAVPSTPASDGASTSAVEDEPASEEAATDEDEEGEEAMDDESMSDGLGALFG